MANKYSCKCNILFFQGNKIDNQDYYKQHFKTVHTVSISDLIFPFLINEKKKKQIQGSIIIVF